MLCVPCAPIKSKAARVPAELPHAQPGADHGVGTGLEMDASMEGGSSMGVDPFLLILLKPELYEICTGKISKEYS